jgi:hypothetical protein
LVVGHSRVRKAARALTPKNKKKASGSLSDSDRHQTSVNKAVARVLPVVNCDRGRVLRGCDFGSRRRSRREH